MFRPPHYDWVSPRTESSIRRQKDRARRHAIREHRKRVIGTFLAEGTLWLLLFAFLLSLFRCVGAL
jgi:hypothetical protein